MGGDVAGVSTLEAACKFNLATVRARGMVHAYAIDSKNMADLVRQFPDEKKKLETLMQMRRREMFTTRRRQAVSSPDFEELNHGILARSISDQPVQHCCEPQGPIRFASTDGQ